MTKIITEHGFKTEIISITFDDWWNGWKFKPVNASQRDKEVAEAAWLGGWMMAGVVTRQEAREVAKEAKRRNETLPA